MILYRKDDIIVHRRSGVRSLWIGNQCQGQMSESKGTPISKYMREIMVTVDSRRHRSFLFIGLGAGILPNWYNNGYRNVTVIEPRLDIISVAQQYFNLDKDVYIIHGRAEFSILSLNKFDCIVLDAFDGNNPIPELYNESFYKEALKHLNHSGSFIRNEIIYNKNVITVLTNA